MPIQFPTNPPPSHTSAMTLLHPILRFSVDQGYELRRSRHARPRRLYENAYLGLTTDQYRMFQDFLNAHRYNVLPFSWQHIHGAETCTYSNTTPVVVTLRNAYISGQWVAMSASTPHTGLNTFWQVTWIGGTSFSLNGSTAGGAGTAVVQPWLPYAIAHLPNDQLDAATKLIGPDAVTNPRGRWNWVVVVEEVF